MMVASTIRRGFIKLSVVLMGPLLRTNKMLPAKAMSMPMTLLAAVSFLKNKAPMMMTKMGVSELSIPASELSISCSTMQKRNAGNRLPKAPDKKMMGNLLKGIFPNAFTATGSSNKPAVTILIAATW